MGGTCGDAREGEGPQGVSFYFVSSLGSLLLGSVIHMQYNTHGLYFMKRNNEKDRFMFPCDGVACAGPCVMMRAQGLRDDASLLVSAQERGRHPMGYICFAYSIPLLFINSSFFIIDLF